MERFNARVRRAVRAAARLVRAPRPVVARGGRGWSSLGITGVFVASLVLYPLLGVAFFPRTDAGQFVINLKAPSGTPPRGDRPQTCDAVEALVRAASSTRGSRADRLEHRRARRASRRIYTSNAGPHTATVQVALKEDHRVGSYEYMDRVRARDRATSCRS